MLLPLLLTSGCLGLIRDPYGTLSGRVTLSVPGEPAAAPPCAAPAGFGARAATLGSSAAQSPSIAGTRAPSRPPEYVVFLREDAATGFAEVAAREGLRLVKTRGEYAVVEDPRRRPFEQVERALLRHPGVEMVTPNEALYPLALPNDPDLCLQWALFALRLPEAWKVTQGSASVVVAVIDSGISFAHSDLRDPKLWEDGWDFVDDTEYRFDPADEARAAHHGTHVAGIIGRLTNNMIGGAGVAWSVRLMPVRVFTGKDPLETIPVDVVAEAVTWAVEHGANVINLSLGCDPRACAPNPLLVRAIERARSEGVAVVAAAGNYQTGFGPVMFPANSPGVIAVGATDRQNGRAFYSAQGAELDVVAPGGGGSTCSELIRAPAADQNDVDACAAGTSLAAPHVSGIVALMLAAGSAHDAEEAEILLTMATQDLSSPGWDPSTGWGLVDAYAAVSAGVPVVFAAAEDGSGRLIAAARPQRPGAGGFYQLRGIPEGRWKVVAWYDRDADQRLSAGDFYGEHPAEVNVRRGARLARLDIVMTPYEGPGRDVVF